MIRRFCSLCEREITKDEIFYDIMITPKKGIDNREEGDNYYDDFCYECTSSGKALVQLMNDRNDDLEAELKKRNEQEKKV